MEDVEITLIVTVADVATIVKVSSKDIGILVDGAVLNGGPVISTDFIDLPEPAIQKKDLQVERPPGHILIEVAQIRIVIHGFIERKPVVMF